jgi:hypothetical protein
MDEYGDDKIRELGQGDPATCRCAQMAAYAYTAACSNGVDVRKPVLGLEETTNLESSIKTISTFMCLCLDS